MKNDDIADAYSHAMARATRGMLKSAVDAWAAKTYGLTCPASTDKAPEPEIQFLDAECPAGSVKIYTVAEESHECYGHGDFGSELKITRGGPYGSGGFPPCFATKEKAEEYIRAGGHKTYCKLAVVALVLLTGCTTSQTPTNVVTDRDGKRHEVLHSEFGATILP